MKKLLIPFVACLAIGCATSTPDKVSYPALQMKNIENKCVPVENYRVGVLSMPAMVLRFNACAGVKDLLLVIVPADDQFAKELRELSQRVIMIHYVDFLHREQSEEGLYTWAAELAAREVQKTDDKNQEVFYYVLTSAATKENIK